MSWPDAERHLTPALRGGQFSRLRGRCVPKVAASHSSVTSCRQRCQRFGTFLLRLQICGADFGTIPSLPLWFLAFALRPPACMLQDFPRQRSETLSRSTSAPQMCKPGLLQSVSPPQLGEALPARDTVFPDAGVTILDNKTENQVSTAGGALLALRSLLFVTHPDV
jgi:hypothetical protein